MTATQLDIANRVHVHPSAVSKILAGDPRFADDTIAAVHAAVADLGYKPRRPRRPVIVCTCTPTHECETP